MHEHAVTEYGAVGDGETIDTAAIQDAVDACADTGGRVVLPAGTYRSGPIFLRSDVEFHVEAGARLVGRDELDAFPAIDGRWEGKSMEHYASLLTGQDLENVAITGHGTIDANGQPWWDAHQATVDEIGLSTVAHAKPWPDDVPLAYPRPRTINLFECENVTIRGLRIEDSPSWTIHPVYCDDLVIEDVTIHQPYESPNSDGINPDSCRNVRIANCHVDCGDDCITLKSGYNEEGRTIGRPTEDVTITNCTTARGRAAVAIGSEMSGDVRNVTVSNCAFHGTKRGLRIKTRRGRGGVVEGIRATNVVMRDVEVAISLRTNWGDGESEQDPVTERTPAFRDVHFDGITAFDVEMAGDIEGLPEQPLDDFRLSNVRVRDADQGVEIRDGTDVVLDDVTVDAADGPAVALDTVSGCSLTRIRGDAGTSVRLTDVTDALVDPRIPGGTPDGYVDERGETSGVEIVTLDS